MRDCGTKHIRCSPYHTSSNGQAEKFVQIFKRAMRAGEKDEPSIHRRLSDFLFSYKSTPHATTATTLSELFMHTIQSAVAFHHGSSRSMSAYTEGKPWSVFSIPHFCHWNLCYGQGLSPSTPVDSRYHRPESRTTYLPGGFRRWTTPETPHRPPGPAPSAISRDYHHL